MRTRQQLALSWVLVGLAAASPGGGEARAQQIKSLVGSTTAVDDIYEPGKVYMDRRDELRGGRRSLLRGLRPRVVVTPRSRVNPAPPAGLADTLEDAPITAVPPRQRLPRAVALCQARYKSFDEETGTYRTYRGTVRVCPYLK
jgi:hypothetical protein